MPTTVGYKAFTHDLRSPLMGGIRLWDGGLPFVLPRVDVDLSDAPCARGWYACLRLPDTLAFAGLWAHGRAVRVFRVETDGEVVHRVFESDGVKYPKCRAATWTITAEVPVDEVALKSGLGEVSEVVAADVLPDQARWFAALGSRVRDPASVAGCLSAFLDASAMPFVGLRQRGVPVDDLVGTARFFNGSRLGRAYGSACSYRGGVPSRREQAVLHGLMGDLGLSGTTFSDLCKWRCRTLWWWADRPPAWTSAHQAFYVGAWAALRHLTLLLVSPFGWKPNVPSPLAGVEFLRLACAAGLGGVALGADGVLEWWMEDPFVAMRHVSSIRRPAVVASLEVCSPA